jgi:hypothetical protein
MTAALFRKGGHQPDSPKESFYNGFTYSDTFDVPYQCWPARRLWLGVTAQYTPGGPVFDLLQGSIYPLQGMFMNF